MRERSVRTRSGHGQQKVGQGRRCLFTRAGLTAAAAAGSECGRGRGRSGRATVVWARVYAFGSNLDYSNVES
ncbi:Hypothetical predicted protein [Marmota monax]|uniref:Uncharacterized protein n=1 Tax=Marmota monax TaxID=9995 RepID=A0A5E4B3E3_MARMO|nr:Hypothetical predicted protein [Marmota monax]